MRRGPAPPRGFPRAPAAGQGPIPPRLSTLRHLSHECCRAGTPDRARHPSCRTAAWASVCQRSRVKTVAEMAPSLTVKEYIDTHWWPTQARNPSTLERMEQRIRRHILPHTVSLPLNAVGTELSRFWKKELEKDLGRLLSGGSGRPCPEYFRPPSKIVALLAIPVVRARSGRLPPPPTGLRCGVRNAFWRFVRHSRSVIGFSSRSAQGSVSDKEKHSGSVRTSAT